jgi:hypothetical protein
MDARHDKCQGCKHKRWMHEPEGGKYLSCAHAGCRCRLFWRYVEWQEGQRVLPELAKPRLDKRAGLDLGMP